MVEAGGIEPPALPREKTCEKVRFHVIDFLASVLILSGMTDDLKALLERALMLPPEARAALAGSLLDSLDQEVDDDVEAAWSTKITKRISELDSGKVQTETWSQVRRSILGG